MKLIWGASLSAAALLLLLLGTLSNSWWTLDQGRGSLGLGLLSAEQCAERWEPATWDDPPYDEEPEIRCESRRYTKIPLSEAEEGEMTRWIHAGRGAFGAGLVASIVLGLTALFSFARATLPGPVSPGRIAAALCAVAFGVAIVFVLLLPSEADAAGVSIGYSMIAYFLGAALGAAGGILAHMGRDEAHAPRRPAGLPVPGVRQPPSPACPQCHAPTVYVVDHARHFCTTCRLYV